MSTPRTQRPGVVSPVLAGALESWGVSDVRAGAGLTITATSFGGPIGLARGALLWTIARRTLVHDRR